MAAETRSKTSSFLEIVRRKTIKAHLRMNQGDESDQDEYFPPLEVLWLAKEPKVPQASASAGWTLQSGRMDGVINHLVPQDRNGGKGVNSVGGNAMTIII